MSVFLGAKPLVASTQPAPKVVILSYGRLGGGTLNNDPDYIPFYDDEDDDAIKYFDRKDWAVQLERFIGPLKDCGIDPILLDDIPVKKIPDALKSLHLPPGSIILVNSHGAVEDDVYEVGSDHSPEGWLSGDEVVETIIQSTPSPRIWLGTCHAGACTVKYQCLGGECRGEQASAATMLAFQQVSRLICDGYRGDCSLWRQADTDHDGRIDSEELDAFLVKQANGPMAISYTIEAEDESDLSDKREEFEGQCKGLEGTAQMGDIEITAVPEKKPVKLSQRVVCHFERRPFFSTPDREGKIDDYYDAAPLTFSLDSDRCREK